MLIGNIEEVNRVEELKKIVFNLQMALLRSMDPAPSIVGLIVSIVMVWPLVSIAFIGNPFEPDIVNKVFRLALFSRFGQNFGLSQHIMDITVIAFCLIMLILTVIHFVFDKPLKVLTKILRGMIQIMAFFVVPFTEIVLAKIKAIAVLESVEVELQQIVLVILTSIDLGILLVFLKLNIQPLRRNKANWNYSNDPGFYATLLDMGRVFVLTLDSDNLSFVIISVLLELYKRAVPGGALTTLSQKIGINTSNLVLSIHFGILGSIILDNKYIGFSIWLMLFLGCVFTGCIEFYSENLAQLLPPCDADCYSYYNFYFKIRDEIEESRHGHKNNLKQKNLRTIFSLHRLQCTSEKCYLKLYEFSEEDDILATIEGFVESILHTYRRKSQENQIMYEIWMMEFGKKFQFNLDKTKMSISNQFILQYVTTILKHNQNVDEMRNKKLFNRILLDLLYDTASLYAKFFQEIAKAKPAMETIISKGEEIQENVVQMKNIFKQALKNNEINYNTIELYLKFFVLFFNEKNIDKDLRERLTKIQTKSCKEINQSYLPTLSIYQQTGVIENMNMEAIRLLCMTRQQLKARNISEFFLPECSVELLYERISREEKNLVMIKKGIDDEYSYGQVELTEKYIKNRKFIIFIFKMEPINEFKNIFLVNLDFQMIAMVRKKSQMSSITSISTININWGQIFDNHIFPNRVSLSSCLTINKELPEYEKSVLFMSIFNTYDPNYRFISVQFVRSLQKVTVGRSSVIKQITRNKAKFNFTYKEGKHGIPVIYGYHTSKQVAVQPMISPQAIGKLTLNIHSKITESLMPESQYANGIKVYRLQNGEIYNIDLEDKEGYLDEFQTHQHNDKLEDKKLEWYKGNFCLIMIIVMISLVLTVSSIVINISLRESIILIEDKFNKKENNIAYRMNFNCIIAVFRDINNGLYNRAGRDWKKDMSESIKRIDELQTEPLFSTNRRFMTYRGKNYEGNLNELGDIILSHMNEFLRVEDITIGQEIRRTAILELDSYFLEEINELDQALWSQFDFVITLKNFNLIFSSLATVSYYSLMLLLCFRFAASTKEKLSCIMYISDKEANYHFENAEKVKYIIESINKSFEVDIFNFLNKEHKFRKRKKPKETVLGSKTIYIAALAILLLLCVHFTGISTYAILVKSRITDFQNFDLEGNALISLYSQLTAESNSVDFTGQLDIQKLKAIMQQLSIVQNSRSHQNFKSSFEKEIDTMFFQKSCDLLTKKGFFAQTELECHRAIPDWNIQNPFELGMVTFFNRQHYNIITNVSDTFGATGIYSTSFLRIFSHISQQLNSEGHEYLEKAYHTLSVINLLLIFLNILYGLVAILFNIYFYQKTNHTRKLINFLSSGINRTETTITKSQKRASSNQDNRQKRKMTIDQTLSQVLKNKEEQEDAFHQNSNNQPNQLLDIINTKLAKRG